MKEQEIKSHAYNLLALNCRPIQAGARGRGFMRHRIRRGVEIRLPGDGVNQAVKNPKNRRRRNCLQKIKNKMEQ